MTNTKNTKRALLSSVLALVVCIAMLVGSTFAWFTDNATTSGNTIVSGKLDVALEMEENGAWVNAEGKTLKWITEDQVANVLWEPGCTYKLPKLRVVNNGNLALKYKVVISGLEGDTKLLDAIDFTGIPTENEYVELKNKGDNVEFQIEGHMKEEAGNEYMDLELSGISITVYATQLNYENDSYGPNYDEGLDVDVDDNGMFKTKNDVIYYYPENGGLVLYKVTDDYTEATLNIPEGVTAIGKAAFTVPTTLKKVVFPSTVTSIGYKPFKGSAVEEVVLNEGLTELPEYAFNNAANLKKVNIPSTVKKLNKQAFYACGLTEITIPASVEYIGQNAFASSPNLKTVTIEGKNVTIENNAFRGCSSLETVILLSDSVTLGSGMIFTNTESNNENPNNITVYVISDAVKQTLENNADFKPYFSLSDSDCCYSVRFF